jgi:hypothetical protein
MQWAPCALFPGVKGPGFEVTAKVKTELGYTDRKLTQRMAQGL